MLQPEQSIAEFDFQRRLILPDRLTRPAHAHYMDAADQLLQVYSNSIGQTRQQIHQRAEAILDLLPDCSSTRMAALIKLLDDVSRYDKSRGRKSAELRLKVFEAAAGRHPLVSKVDSLFSSDQSSVKQQIAAEIGLPWCEIEQNLFADIPEFHALVEFTGYPTPAALLARYNVAQVQACLYQASKLTLWAKSDLKVIVQAIKLSRLMHVVRQNSNGEYQFTLTGPANSLRLTRRYGVSMAKMIPMLLSCKDWRLIADILVNRSQRLQLSLSSSDGLSSPIERADEFDSSVEQNLMQTWQRDPIPGWQIFRETAILTLRQKIYLPDFVLEHQSGARYYVEVLGFWTPEYPKAKLQTLEIFRDQPMLIFASTQHADRLADLPLEFSQRVLWFKKNVSLKELGNFLIRLVG